MFLFLQGIQLILPDSKNATAMRETFLNLETRIFPPCEYPGDEFHHTLASNQQITFGRIPLKNEHDPVHPEIGQRFYYISTS